MNIETSSRTFESSTGKKTEVAQRNGRVGYLLSLLMLTTAISGCVTPPIVATDIVLTAGSKMLDKCETRTLAAKDEPKDSADMQELAVEPDSEEETSQTSESAPVDDPTLTDRLTSVVQFACEKVDLVTESNWYRFAEEKYSGIKQAVDGVL